MESETGKEKSSFTVQVNSLGLPVAASDVPQARKRSMFLAQVCLKISAIVFTLAAICVTVTSGQSVLLFGIQFEARYSYSSALKFLVGVDAVLCSSSALSLIFVCILRRSSGSQLIKNYFFVFLHDMVMMALMVSGCAAATAIGYVGRHGEEQMTWHSLCGYVGKFCNKIMVAVALSYLTLFAYLALTLISAHGLVFRSTPTK
ncbi:hypothetical protein FNV43_RR22384 [Rhamnella rubrinervis]|uniref:CASP-like protein n=1 Tax=Rhamnella rubrinervis TaxID=2594499 RepID=A0A8K0GN42_9ROSA|nr:hypothetical protein FNV43_RR22384 [Rhamnella rubrinervis]